MRPHGTITRYVAGCSCTECRKAHRDYRYDERQDRRAARIMVGFRLVHPRAPHGTKSGYSNYGCQCAPCVEAGRISNAAYKARRKAKS